MINVFYILNFKTPLVPELFVMVQFEIQILLLLLTFNAGPF